MTSKTSTTGKAFDLAAYVRASTKAGGVPEKVQDAATLHRAARLGSLDFPNNPHQRRVETEGLLVIVHSRCVLPGRMTIFFTSSLRSRLKSRSVVVRLIPRAAIAAWRRCAVSRPSPPDDLHPLPILRRDDGRPLRLTVGSEVSTDSADAGTADDSLYGVAVPVLARGGLHNASTQVHDDAARRLAVQ
jgi:hypothetical protein